MSTLSPPAPDRATSLVRAGVVIAGHGLRELFRNPQVLATTLGQGVLFLLVFRYVFGGAIGAVEGSYVDHLAPGVVTAGIVFAATGASVAAAQERWTGLTDLLATQPVPRLSLALGRILADATLVFLAAVVLAVAAVAVGFRPSVSAGHLVVGLALVVLYSAAYAAMFGALGALASGPQAAQGLGFLAIPLTFISSAFVPVDSMPTWLAWVAQRQPITVQIEALRGLTVGAETRAAIGTAILVTVGMVIAGLLLRLGADAPRGARPNHGTGV